MATVRTPYTDPTISRRIISDMVGMIDWASAPLVKRLGLEKDKTCKFVNWPPGGQKKIEWIEDTMPSQSTTLSAAISNGTTTTISLTNGDYVHEGSILQIGNEYLIVQAAPTGNTVIVSRGAGGTTPASHSNSAAVHLRGIAKKTGSNYAIGYTTTVTAPYNYTQILEEALRINGDQEGVSDYGVPDTMDYHLSKLIGGRTEIGERGRAGKLIMDLARMAYYGKRQQPSNTQEGMAGGFDTFISTHTYGNSNAALSRATIHTALRDIYNSGGMPDLMVVSPYAAELVTAMYEDLIRTERSEDRGGSTIRYITTPVVDSVELMIDHMCPSGSIYLLDSEKVGWATIRPFTPQEKPSLGDYKVWSVLGEYTFILQNEAAHAKISHATS